MTEDRGTETLTGATEVLQAVMDTSPLAVIALDQARAVRLWSRGAERMFGWSQNEVLGKPLHTVPPDPEMEFRRFWLRSSAVSRSRTWKRSACARMDRSSRSRCGRLPIRRFRSGGFGREPDRRHDDA